MEIHIPKKIQALEPDLKRFFDAMVYKLEKNAHKGKWEDMTIRSLLFQLETEVIELREAIVDGSSMAIVMEAADVANFAMMAASVSLTEEFNGSGGKKSGYRAEMVNSKDHKDPERSGALLPGGTYNNSIKESIATPFCCYCGQSDCVCPDP